MSTKLDLTEVERQKLRMAKIRLGDLHLIRPEELAKAIQVTLERAKYITGLAIFQQIPSIGYRMAYNLVHYLNIYSLKEIKDYDPAYLFDWFEEIVGERIDPCVEDQIRCVIHHANNPGSDKQWFDFTEQRKMDRLA
ncbi:helix-hairpin-helix domain-containing protein [Piscibacillus halophilus]|uniref:Pathogenicity locus n=1 Tax=Piscibacillus halophilus TaxID=571933 RepID=A0A1H9CDW2_9BACI|nr:helix-hairpin-helix domain-containing protein [Piscibacillus halophilus]SEP99197.1 Pathogenicity locus [Piscibacillus halophilus]